MSHAIAQLASAEDLTPGKLILMGVAVVLAIIVASIYDKSSDVDPPGPDFFGH